MKQIALTLDHHGLLDPLLKAIHLPLSEYCFSNLYFFRKPHQFEVLSRDGDLFISGLSYDQQRYLMPLKDPGTDTDYAGAMIRVARDHGCHMLFPIAEQWLPVFTDSGLTHHSLGADSDYLYAIHKMQQYPGRKLHKKRNLVKQYEKLYRPGVHVLSGENIDQPLALLDLWQKNSGLGQSDYAPCREALTKFEQFHLTGAIFHADDQPVGFIIGEAITPEVFTLHFAKADVRYKGVYQFMFSRFAQQFCTGYREINLAQDMGIEGLRKNKRSYLPDRMGIKYRVMI